MSILNRLGARIEVKVRIRRVDQLPKFWPEKRRHAY
jgi:hypothetical protein